MSKTSLVCFSPSVSRSRLCRSWADDDITESSRASLFAERIRWAAGLLDIRVAADRKRDGKKFYFTVSEWQTIDNASRSEEFLLRGLRIRADGLSFVMAMQFYKNK